MTSEPDSLHPRLESLLAYWFVKSAGRKMPSRAGMPLKDWERWHRNLALFEVVQYGALRLYECRLSAADLFERFGCEATGLSVDALKPSIRFELRADLEAAFLRKAPVFARRRLWSGTSLLIFCDLVLPLSEKGETVDSLLFASYPATE
ncbi:MAG TPA: hypothetical protein VGG48_16355 [Rhizomicrobium sp.]|jgi:hypothetical protein